MTIVDMPFHRLVFTQNPVAHLAIFLTVKLDMCRQRKQSSNRLLAEITWVF